MLNIGDKIRLKMDGHFHLLLSCKERFESIVLAQNAFKHTTYVLSKDGDPSGHILKYPEDLTKDGWKAVPNIESFKGKYFRSIYTPDLELYCERSTNESSGFPDGMTCHHCGEFSPYADQSNQADGTFWCWSCRFNPYR